MKFQPATKTKSRLRLALLGGPGSGKSYTALSIAKHLVPSGRVAVIDTERGSASKYADLFSFDVLELESFSPMQYVKAIQAADAAKFDVVIVDSLSHAWNAKDGALEMVDAAARRSNSGNSFAAWREVTPEHNRMVEAILNSNAHVIATMRVKVEWVLEENDRGKKVPKKVGMAPVQRDGLDYEFDVVGDLDSANVLHVTKTRCPKLVDGYFERPGEDVATILREWLTDGVEPTEKKSSDRDAQIDSLIAGIESAKTFAELEKFRPAIAKLPAGSEVRAAAGNAYSDKLDEFTIATIAVISAAKTPGQLAAISDHLSKSIPEQSRVFTAAANAIADREVRFREEEAEIEAMGARDLDR